MELATSHVKTTNSHCFLSENVVLGKRERERERQRDRERQTDRQTDREKEEEAPTCTL